MSKSPRRSTSGISLHAVLSPDTCPSWTNWDQLAQFLHHSLKPYQDTLADIGQGIQDAFQVRGGRTGFVLIAEEDKQIAGALVMLRTGMKGYLPENLLLFVAVAPERRGEGVGKRLVEQAIQLTDGNIKLHVEYENPAKGLYKHLGFETKYAEMRYTR